MTDGLEGVLKSVSTYSQRFPEFSYDVKRITVDGELVTLHVHATMYAKDRGNDRRGLNIVDTWRVVDGQVVEHWDAVQPLNWFLRFYQLLTGGAIRNTNGVF